MTAAPLPSPRCYANERGSDALFQMKCLRWETGSMRRRRFYTLWGQKAFNFGEENKNESLDAQPSFQLIASFWAKLPKWSCDEMWHFPLTAQPSTHTHTHKWWVNNIKVHIELFHEVILRIIELTIVVSAMDPKLLIKMLQVTFTGGPAERGQRGNDGEVRVHSNPVWH